MRTILTIGEVFTVASLQADAKRFILHDRHLDQVTNNPNMDETLEVLAGSQFQTTSEGGS